MARRLVREAVARGVDEPDRLEDAFGRAMEPRHRLLDDDHDPRYLHPGRSALVLMSDGGVVDGRWILASILTETASPELAFTPARQAPAWLHEAWVRAREVPGAEDPDLAERLLTAEPEAAVLALCEYLDQLRHLRLWAGAARVARVARTAEEILLPVARRSSPVLARRFEWWVRRVGRGLSAS
jgi:hypothetical protein